MATAIITIRMLIAMPILFEPTRSRIVREMTLVTFAMDQGRGASTRRSESLAQLSHPFVTRLLQIEGQRWPKIKNGSVTDLRKSLSQICERRHMAEISIRNVVACDSKMKRLSHPDRERPDAGSGRNRRLAPSGERRGAHLDIAGAQRATSRRNH